MLFVCFLLSSFLFLTTEGTTTCTDFTINGCTRADSFLIQDVEVPDEMTCQTYCRDVYEGECRYYILEEGPPHTCWLYRSPFGSYVESYISLGAPPIPEAEECMAAQDPCTFYIEGECTYTGAQLDELKADTIDKCQLQCSLDPECKYVEFTPNNKNRECRTLASPTKTCLVTHGPPEPTRAVCESSNSTF